MTGLIFPAYPPITVPITGDSREFPLHRIFCVGRNYAAHAAEMGGQVDREAPWYFCKTPSAYCPSGATIPYAPGTNDFHHEVELVVALGADGFRTPQDVALDLVFGYAAGLDLTRRDRQQDGKDHRRPWDLGKDFENAAVIAPITPKAECPQIMAGQITLAVNGETRQSAPLADMVWSVAEVISHLSQYYHLRAGDVIMTGTPAGVGPMQVGDHLHGEITGLAPVTLDIAAPE